MKLVKAHAFCHREVLTDDLAPTTEHSSGRWLALAVLCLAALSDVAPEDSGLASGVVNTAFMMGGALGMATLASLAASHTDSLLAIGSRYLAALNGGYHVAFLVGALFAAVASVLGAALLRATRAAAPPATKKE